VSALVLLTGLLSPSTISARAASSAPTATTIATAVVSPAATATNVGAPSWWVGDCDTTRWGPLAKKAGWTGVASHRLGAAYLGVPVCGPRPWVDGSPNVQWGRAGWGEAEWQCVEVAQRFMAQVYGTVAYGANGSQVVNNYRTSYGGSLVRITNGTVGKAPQPGDIVSFTTPNNPYGHVVVIATSSVDGNGNGSVTALSQNDTANGWRTFAVAGWKMAGFGSLTPYAWLHDPAGRGNPLADGTYVKATGVSGTFRIVGGAPIRVTAWANVGGYVPYVTIEAAQFNRLRAFPSDGTYLKDFSSGTTYRVAGGAPLAVSRADAAKMPGAGTAPVWTIDHTSLTNNERLAAVPADRTQICRVDTRECYLVAGGAPIQVPASDVPLVPGWNPAKSTVVSGAEFTSWTRLRSTPADGTFLCDTTTTTCYSTAGGAALTLPAVDAPRIPGWSSAKVVRVSHYEFSHHAHLRRYPRDGTKICPLDDTTCYVVAGRAPLPISATAAATVAALKTTGAPRISSYEMRRPTNLALRPVDGTLLQTAAVKGVYVVSSGAASFSASAPASAASTPPVVVDQAAIDNAGLSGRWAHLLSNPALMKLTSPTVVATTSSRVVVSWERPVASSAVTSYAMRLLSAMPTTASSGWVVPTQWTSVTATSATLPVAPGQTLCFSVRATNRAGQVGPWSSARCTARALDQTAGTVSRTWRLATSPKLYLGTAMTTTTRLSTWSLANVTTDRVGIVASRCATCGSVNIFVGRTLVGSIDLQAPTTSYRNLIMLPRFTTRSGQLTIVVRSADGRTVQLDGVVASAA
jgi:hypothetical protein